MKQTIYYTVLTRRTFFMVKYAISPQYQILTFPGMFDDPGEASQEFKKTMQSEPEHLTEVAFERKVSFLSTHYKQDLARLADWNAGKKVRA